MKLIDTSRDRVDISSHLRMLADMIDVEDASAGEGSEARVRQPYQTPRLTTYGLAPVDLVMAFRARRNELFAADLFGEPAWDMLLELFRARREGRELSVKSLTIAASAPQTTAGRHLVQLIGQGLATCADDPGDGRRKLVAITRDGYLRMEKLFDKAA